MRSCTPGVALALAETPGEDPLINGDYAVHFVQGMQQRGVDPKYIKVGATCKHAFGYSLEGHKCSGGGDPECIDPEDRHHFNAVISPQDLADTYLPPFERCVKEGKPASLMCSCKSMS
jgi:beta-glucosidase-like glycosyl hydrolase